MAKDGRFWPLLANSILYVQFVGLGEIFDHVLSKYMYFQNVGLSSIPIRLTSLIAPQSPNYMYFEIRSFTSTCTLKVYGVPTEWMLEMRDLSFKVASTCTWVKLHVSLKSEIHVLWLVHVVWPTWHSTFWSYESPKVHVVWVEKAYFWLYILINSRWVKPLAELGIGPQRYHPWAQLSPPTLGQTRSDWPCYGVVKVLFSDAFWEISDLADLSQVLRFPVVNIPGHTPELPALLQVNLGKLASEPRPIIHVHQGEHV